MAGSSVSSNAVPVHIIMAYGGSASGIGQSFLTSAQGGEECWTLCPSGFTSRNKPWYPLNGRVDRPPELMWTFCWRKISMFINWNFYLICNLTNKHIKICRILCLSVSASSVLTSARALESWVNSLWILPCRFHISVLGEELLLNACDKYQ